jgi:hypothetical protein
MERILIYISLSIGVGEGQIWWMGVHKELLGMRFFANQTPTKTTQVSLITEALTIWLVVGMLPVVLPVVISIVGTVRI